MSAILDILKWFWDTFGKELTNQTYQQAKINAEQINWPNEKANYLHSLQKQHADTFVLDRNIKIQNIFTDVFMLERLTSFRRDEIKDLEKRFEIQRSLHLEDRRKPLADIVETKKHLFVLGKPGAGKTTLLKYLTLQACSGRIKKTPVFVVMRNWIDSKQLLIDFVLKQFETNSFPKANMFLESVLRKGDAIVMLDGLDELNTEEINSAISQISDFIHQYSNASVCISCRIGAFEPFLDDFYYVEIADFDERQRINFSRKWFKDNPEMMEKFLRKLSLSENQNLRELARTPLLLALLCIVFESNLAFPHQLVDLYKEALDVLLVKWDSKRRIARDDQYFRLSLRQKEQLLARLAAQNFQEGKFFFEKRHLARQIEEYYRQIPSEKDTVDGLVILKAVQSQHGLLVERSRDIFSFSHLVFQEFLTAYFIAENSGDGSVARLISTYKADRRWSDIFLMVFSLLDDSTNYFELFLKEAQRAVLNEKEIEFLIFWSNSMASKSARPGIAHRTIFLFWALLFVKVKTPNVSGRLSHLRELVEKISQLVDSAPELQEAFLNAKSISLSLAQTGHFNLRQAQKMFEKLGVSLSNSDLEYHWFLDDDGIKALENYLQTNILLLKCLNVSTVRDRKSIESRILSPTIM